MLPAWDAITGGLAATGLLAAERHRSRTGEGQLARVALSDVAFAMVGHLGRVAEAQLGSQDTPKDGNYLYGAFGHDFATSDGRRVMVVALTTRQWNALLQVTGLDAAVSAIEKRWGDSCSRSRTASRPATCWRPCSAMVRSPHAKRYPRRARGHRRVLGRLPDLLPLVREDARRSTDNEMWELVQHPGVGSYLMPGTPLDFSAVPRVPVRRAPQLGEHTEAVLSDLLDMTTTEIGRLERDGVVHCARS